MNILHLSTYDRGGAAEACINLHRGLLKKGVNSKLLTLYKTREDIENHYSYDQITLKPKSIYSSVLLETLKLIRKIWNKLSFATICRKAKPKGFDMFSFPDADLELSKTRLIQDAEIVNLHWVAGFIDYKKFFKQLESNKRIVWTMHDMNPFTGGCHYANGCTKYKQECEKCPQLKMTSCPENYSHKIFKYKKIGLSKSKGYIQLVSPSVWLTECAKQSALFKQYSTLTIKYSTDEDIYKQYEKIYARQFLKIPVEAKVILFVADDLNNQRKGFKILLDALKLLPSSGNRIVLCSVGSRQEDGLNIKNDENIFSIELGRINDRQTMALAYAAADVFVIPSIEDNLPNTIIESLMCGTPVIGFSIGGLKDLLVNNVNGILVEVISSENLSKAITKFFEIKFDRGKIRSNAAEKFKLSVQAENYISLYKNIKEQ